MSTLPSNAVPSRSSAQIAGALAILLMLAIGYVYRGTIEEMVTVWRSGETFAHGPLMPLISLWLVWRKRSELRELPVKAFWPALLPLTAAGFVWLLGDLAGANVVKHFALTTMLVCVVPLVFGWRITQALLFPLGFVFFAVPFGDFLMDRMMLMTADFTVAAVKLSGVPIIREGLQFELPSGRWSVVEACSGLRYLLAAMPLGCLYAYLSYRSSRARVLFVLTVIVVAITANWLRAYLIVMIGHLSNMRLAVGVDHLIYGWVFFGIVMALSFWLGSRWADAPDAPAPGRSPGSAGDAFAQGDHPAAALATATIVGLLVVTGWPLLGDSLRAKGEPRMSLAIAATGINVLTPPSDERIYYPGYSGGIDRLFGTLRSDPQVAMLAVHYDNQRETGEMISAGNRVLTNRPNPGWQVLKQRTIAPAPTIPGSVEFRVNEYEIATPNGRYLAWEWFWVNGRPLAKPREVKLYTAFDMLCGRGDESIAWVLWTPSNDDPGLARQRLQRAIGKLGEPAALAKRR